MKSIPQKLKVNEINEHRGVNKTKKSEKITHKRKNTAMTRVAEGR